MLAEPFWSDPFSTLGGSSGEYAVRLEATMPLSSKAGAKRLVSGSGPVAQNTCAAEAVAFDSPYVVVWLRRPSSTLLSSTSQARVAKVEW